MTDLGKGQDQMRHTDASTPATSSRPRWLRRRLLVVVAVVVALGSGGLALCLVSARGCLDESLYTTPGHFAYYACVSSMMRHVPRVLPATEPTFYASAGDGPKPAQDEMTYLSRAIPTDVVA